MAAVVPLKKVARGIAQAADWLCHGRGWMKPAAVTSYARSARSAKGDRMNPYLDPQAEFFDRAIVPPQIQELLDAWPDIGPGTARLVRAAVMSYDPRQRRHAWELLAAQAELAGVLPGERKRALLTSRR
jgi:hypothetical protein